MGRSGFGGHLSPLEAVEAGLSHVCPPGAALPGLAEGPVVDSSYRGALLSDVPAPTLFSALLPLAFYSGAVVTVYIWHIHITVHLTIPGRDASPRVLAPGTVVTQVSAPILPVGDMAVLR